MLTLIAFQSLQIFNKFIKNSFQKDKTNPQSNSSSKSHHKDVEWNTRNAVKWKRKWNLWTICCNVVLFSVCICVNDAKGVRLYMTLQVLWEYSLLYYCWNRKKKIWSSKDYFNFYKIVCTLFRIISITQRMNISEDSFMHENGEFLRWEKFCIYYELWIEDICENFLFW